MARRARRLCDTALCLRRFRYGESSLLVHALTPRHGRVAILAKGAYRLRSGYFGALDLFDTLELEWSRSGSELGVLRTARIVQRRRGVSAALPRYRAALSALELCSVAARSDHAEPELFGSLAAALDHWSEGTTAPEVVLAAFDLAWLRQAGLAPALAACASCGRAAPAPGDEVEETAAFSAGAGGLLCRRCAAEPPRRGAAQVRVPWSLLRAAHGLAATPLGRLEQAGVAPALVPPLCRLVGGFLEVHLERRLKSRGGPPRLSARRRAVRR